MDKLDHLGWVVSSSFAIGDVRFAVRSTSHVFGEWIREALGAYEIEDVEDFLYSVVVPDVGSGGKTKEFCILYKGSSAIVRTLDPTSLGRALVAELEGLALHERDDAVYLMASVIDVRGVPAIVPSSLAPGLAKLGRRAGKLGVAVPGQFEVAVDTKSATLVPVPATLDVAGDALERLTNALGWEGADGLRFVQEPEEIGALLVPAREPDVSLQSAKKGYALAHLAEWTLNLGEVGGEGLEALGRFVENTPCYESVWTEAVDVITELAERVGEPA